MFEKFITRMIREFSLTFGKESFGKKKKFYLKLLEFSLTCGKEKFEKNGFLFEPSGIFRDLVRKISKIMDFSLKLREFSVTFKPMQ